jgi:hypothetical protein
MSIKRTAAALMMGAAALAVLPQSAGASSHREAPFIAELPKVDGTDLYVFNSYEPGRTDFVTILANYQPLQAPYGGPNFFGMDDSAAYDIKIDNDGDALAELTFRFRFSDRLGGTNGQGIALNIGAAGSQVPVAVPLINVGKVSTAAGDQGNINFFESFTLDVIRATGRRGQGASAPVTNASGGGTSFPRPLDNIGSKTFTGVGLPFVAGATVTGVAAQAAYETYARSFIHTINIPNCAQPGRVFVGQRQEGFYVNLGQVFDLVSAGTLAPLGSDVQKTLVAPLGEQFAGALPNTTDDFNITTLALEVHKSCLTAPPVAGQALDPVIGVWTTASLPRTLRLNRLRGTAAGFDPEVNAGPLVQVSRLGMPLVNELVIGLRDKDGFNASQPIDDGQFATYVTNPTLPALLEALFGTAAPTSFPRVDLVEIFAAGILGLNAPANAYGPDGELSPTFNLSEMMRFNTSSAISDRGDQSRLGALGIVPSTRGAATEVDDVGFPNGRRPGDDAVDISLRGAMGVAVDDPADAPSGTLAFIDGALMGRSYVDSGVGTGAPMITIVDGCTAEPAGAMGAAILDWDCSGVFGTRFPFLNPPLPADFQP